MEREGEEETPLPPGFVPTEYGRNEGASFLEQQQHTLTGNHPSAQPHLLLKERVIEEKYSQARGEDEEEDEEEEEEKGEEETTFSLRVPTKAWGSPESASATEATRQDEREKEAVHHLDDESKEKEDIKTSALTKGPIVDLQPPTPKRLLSPFRRHNRVSPFTPGGREKLSNSRPKQAGSHVQLQVVTKATSPLSGSETSLVKDRDSAEQDPSWQSHSSGATQDRPKSAPSTKQNALTSSPLAQAITAKEVSEPLYSKVKKKNKKKQVPSYDATTESQSTPSRTHIVQATPVNTTPELDSCQQLPNRKEEEEEEEEERGLVLYDPESYHDNSGPSVQHSTPIHKKGQVSSSPHDLTQHHYHEEGASMATASSSMEATEAKEKEESGTASSAGSAAVLAGDYTYEEVDFPTFKPSVYKNLKKHEDNGNVQLVSMWGAPGPGGSDVPQSKSMDFSQGNAKVMYPIHYAAANGNRVAIENILRVLPVVQDSVEQVLGTEYMCRREGVDTPDSEGRTALMHAVHNDHPQCVRLLAEAGASVNTPSNDGSGCLHDAVYNGSIEMVALLLSLGADGLKIDKDGRNPLHWSTNNANPDCIDVLLDKVPSLSVDVRDKMDMTPLMWAAYNGKPEHIKRLRTRGADDTLRDVDGMSAVHWSIQKNDTRALRELINLSSSKFYDNKRKTVMHQAAEQGCAKAISLIKAVRPTSVDDLDCDGRTPLHWATVCENPEVIRALLANGANASLQDCSGYTALDYALERQLHYCALLLSSSQTAPTEETDFGYRSYMTYGAGTSAGERALQQQEGLVLNSAVLTKLTHENILQIKMVCRGSWMNKFMNNGKGPLHARFFRVDPSLMKLVWSSSKQPDAKETKSDTLVGVRSSASQGVLARKDFDPVNRHKYSFTIFTSTRVLNVVALSSEDFKLWLNGLQLVLSIGSVNVISVLNS